MTASYGGSDAEGAWRWKDAYDVAEVAEIRHLLKIDKALIATDPATALERVDAVAALQPPNRHRTEGSPALQQFSTPATYAYAAFLAAEICNADVVLEPSAGHGALAVFARIGGGKALAQRNRRLLQPIGNIPPTEAEARYYAHFNELAMVA